VCSNNDFYKHTSDTLARIKVSDCAIRLKGRRSWPTIVFEFGHVEPVDDFQDDLRLVLDGSRGKISKDIIIKIEQLHEAETKVKRVFVEMWNLINNNTIKNSGRKVSFYNSPISGFTFTNAQI